MLIKLIGRYIRPYRGEIVAVLILQLIAAVASLLLPSLNARIIDDGVAKGDTAFILSHGAIMLAVALTQAGSQVAAVYFAARAAMGGLGAGKGAGGPAPRWGSDATFAPGSSIGRCRSAPAR